MTEKNGDLKYKTDNAIDEAYRRGYEDKAKEIRDGEYTFYEKGLNDAWECAKKAWSMSETDFHKIFNTEWDFEYMLDNLSATEVVQKIKDYEERQTETETWISMDKSRKITVPKGTFEKILSDADDDYDI